MQLMNFCLLRKANDIHSTNLVTRSLSVSKPRSKLLQDTSFTSLNLLFPLIHHRSNFHLLERNETLIEGDLNISSGERRSIPTVYYMVAGVGLVLLLVIVVSVVSCRRNRRAQKRSQKVKLSQSNQDLDPSILQRHQMAKKEETGIMNPGMHADEPVSLTLTQCQRSQVNQIDDVLTGFDKYWTSVVCLGGQVSRVTAGPQQIIEPPVLID